MNNVNYLNGYLTSLIHKEGIKKQFKFTKTLLKNNGFLDPLKEKSFTKTPGLIHRYPDRVVLTVTNRCFAYCNFCFRKNNWYHFEGFDLEIALEYLRKTTQIREVLISGGDPLTLSSEKLDEIISKIKVVKNIKTIRIGSRALSVYPNRINDNLLKIFQKHSPLWLAIHINHPDEITETFKEKALSLIKAGTIIIAQTVLLKNINDDKKVLEELFCRLVEIGIKPYYLFGCDQAKANQPYRVPIPKALKIIEKLRFRISGLCMPLFAFDLPQGAGKVALEPNRIIKKEKNIYIFRNFEGKEIRYEDV